MIDDQASIASSRSSSGMVGREEAKSEREFEELFVRSETGLGAEVPINGAGPRERPREREKGAA
jgi:hypothetical protein